jgi:hypothetical protein
MNHTSITYLELLLLRTLNSTLWQQKHPDTLNLTFQYDFQIEWYSLHVFLLWAIGTANFPQLPIFSLYFLCRCFLLFVELVLEERVLLDVHLVSCVDFLGNRGGLIRQREQKLLTEVVQVFRAHVDSTVVVYLFERG